MIFSAIALIVSAICSDVPNFLKQEQDLAGDILATIGSGPLPNCGHLEYKTNIPDLTDHIIEIYGCDGIMVDNFTVELVNLTQGWNTLNHHIESFALRPKVIGTKDGFAIVYETEAKDVRIAFFTLRGVLLTNMLVAKGGYHPDVALLADGKIILMWHAAVSYELFVLVFDSGGRKIWDQPLSIASFGNHGKVSGYTDGGWVAVFEGLHCGCVYAYSQPAEGPPVTIQLTPDAPDAVRATYPRVHAFGEGMGFTASWWQEGKLYLRNYDEKGNPLIDIVQLAYPGNDADVNETNFGFPLDTALGSQGFDGYVLAWSEDSSSFHGTVALEITANGTLAPIRFLYSIVLIPTVHMTSSGYGVDFFAFATKAHFPDILLFAPCNLTSVPCSSGEFHPENICSLYPCDEDSCCFDHDYGVTHDDSVISPTVVKADGSAHSNRFDLKQIRQPYVDMDLFIPVSPSKKGSRIKLECGSQSLRCTFLLVVYSCSPCSDGFDGGFPQSLPGLGWVEVGGAPRFQIPQSSGSYPMRSFKIELPGDSTVQRWTEIVAEGEGTYLAIFGKQGGVSQDPPVPSENDDTGCSFPSVFMEMSRFLADYSKFSKLGSP